VNLLLNLSIYELFCLCYLICNFVICVNSKFYLVYRFHLLFQFGEKTENAYIFQKVSPRNFPKFLNPKFQLMNIVKFLTCVIIFGHPSQIFLASPLNQVGSEMLIFRLALTFDLV